MEYANELHKELNYLSQYNKKAISISTTAKHEFNFRVLPRRVYKEKAISNFMINDEQVLNKVLSFFDGKVKTIFIDVEQKQGINLFEIAREKVKKSQLISIKPNDTTLESCDTLVRHYFEDDLLNKNIIVIGTGNLASKISVRLAERQANVFLKGRAQEKERDLVEALNLFLPKNSPQVQSFLEKDQEEKVDVIISFLSGPFEEEDTLLPIINEETFIIDGGINNFNDSFIRQLLKRNIKITRLDTRIALPYQLLIEDEYTTTFFEEMYGQAKLGDISIVSGGFIGAGGSVIVDNIKEPSQIIGIADGKGGVKNNEQLSESERNRIQSIKQAISEHA